MPDRRPSRIPQRAADGFFRQRTKADERGPHPRFVGRVTARQRKNLRGAIFRAGMAAPRGMRRRERNLDVRRRFGSRVTEQSQTGFRHFVSASAAAEEPADEHFVIIVRQEQAAIRVGGHGADELRHDGSSPR